MVAMTTNLATDLHTILARLCDPGDERPMVRQPVAIGVDGRTWLLGTDGGAALALRMPSGSPIDPRFPRADSIERKGATAMRGLIRLCPVSSVVNIPVGELRDWLGPPVECGPRLCTTCRGTERPASPSNSYGRCALCGNGEYTPIPEGFIRRGWIGDASLNLNLVARVLADVSDEAVRLGVLGSTSGKTLPAGPLAIDGKSWRALVMPMNLGRDDTKKWSGAPVCPWWPRGVGGG